MLTSVQSKRRRGATLVEMLVTVAIGAMVFAVLISLLYSTSLQLALLFAYSEQVESNQLVADRLSREVRSANKVTSVTTNTLVLEDEHGTNVTYTYNASAKTLSRTWNSGTTVLLKECDAFAFTLGKRNPGGAFEVFPAVTNASECKVLNASWASSRSILGKKLATDNMGTCRIVIRRQGT